MASVWGELKRRNVVRVAIAYAIVAWFMIEVSATTFPMLKLPEWAATLVTVLLLIGFPVAIIFAWAFELTPEGLKKEKDVTRSESVTHVTGRKLDFAIIAMMTLAIVYLVVDNYVFDKTLTPATESVLEKSIAVLPFRNRSDNDADIHFVDGIHDDILTKLAKLSTLDRVISRTSTERYRETSLPIPQIGEELGVATILEGGVQRAGNQIHINVQLIEAKTDEHLWAESYDRELTVENLFAIQNEISHEIVAALHGVLSDEESKRLQQMPTTSLEAHAELAFGRKVMAERTGKAILQAQAHFEKAVELDPDYALAWVGLADALSLQWEYLGRPLESTYAAREAAISKALAIDPLSGEAYASLALLRRNQQQLEEAEDLYLKAIRLSPNYATAYHWYSLLLQGQDRFQESESQIRKAIELDPMAPILRTVLTNILQLLGRTDEAKAEVLEGLRRNPEFPGFYLTMATMHLWEGRIGEALMWYRTAARLNPSAIIFRILECELYLMLADDESAESCIDAMDADRPDATIGLRARLFESRGQYDEAVALAETLLETGASPNLKPYFTEVLFFAGKWDAARAVLEETHPALFSHKEWMPSGLGDGFWGLWVPSFAGDLFPGIIAASILRADNELERANYLFDQALVSMQSMSRSGPAGYEAWDGLIHLARNDKQKFIAAVRETIDGGFWTWRYKSPVMAPMLVEPEWLSLIGEIEAERARQRQWYEEHKDDALF